MTALMQEVVDRVHALPEYKRDDVVSRLLGVISEEESAPDERVIYVEVADDLTEEEQAEMAALSKEYREHPENYTDFSDYLAEIGLTEKDLEKLEPTRIVYNI